MCEEVEWRRRWKNKLKCCPWQSIKVDGSTPLFMKCLFTDDKYEILLSDVTNTWVERLYGKDIGYRNKEINPSIEVPLAKLLQHLEEVLQNRSMETTYTFEPSSEKGIVLTASFNFAGLPFTWKFYCQPADCKMVCEHLTEPLLTMISHLTYQRDQLFRLLRNKDKEIFDLKSQGIQSSRKNLETKTFDETSFLNEMLSSKEFEDQVRNGGKNIFSDQGQQLYSAVMMKTDWLVESAKAAAEGVTSKEQTFDGSCLPVCPPNGGSSWATNRVPPSLVASGTATTPNGSPNKSPLKQGDTKDVELQRRQQLEAKRTEQDDKEPKKKKKKLKF